MPFRDHGDYVERSFRHVAESRRQEFGVKVTPEPPRAIHTDAKRLRQVLKNLLSNTFKFTEVGGVTLDVAQAVDGRNSEHESLNLARSVVTFTVGDTGIGIPSEKQQIFFGAFQQADACSAGDQADERAGADH